MRFKDREFLLKEKDHTIDLLVVTSFDPLLLIQKLIFFLQNIILMRSAILSIPLQ